jgi:hypothetical protein
MSQALSTQLHLDINHLATSLIVSRLYPAVMVCYNVGVAFNCCQSLDLLHMHSTSEGAAHHYLFHVKKNK